MHQNLRTSFVLNNRSLNESKKEGFAYLQEMQTLIPVKQYGTFFCIYAKFTGELKDGKLYPKTCDLFLQNYDGDVTVGLVSVDNEIDTIFDEFIAQPVYLLKIHVRALHAKAKFDKPQKIALKRPGSLKNYVHFKKKNENWGIDVHAEGIDPKFLINVLIYFDELPQETFDPKRDVNENLFIDSHRYKRDGDELLKKKFEKVGSGVLKPLDQIVIDEKNGIIKPPPQCAPAYVQLYLGDETQENDGRQKGKTEFKKG